MDVDETDYMEMVDKTKLVNNADTSIHKQEIAGDNYLCCIDLGYTDKEERVVVVGSGNDSAY